MRYCNFLINTAIHDTNIVPPNSHIRTSAETETETFYYFFMRIPKAMFNYPLSDDGNSFGFSDSWMFTCSSSISNNDYKCCLEEIRSLANFRNSNYSSLKRCRIIYVCSFHYGPLTNSTYFNSITSFSQLKYCLFEHQSSIWFNSPVFQIIQRLSCLTTPECLISIPV